MTTQDCPIGDRSNERAVRQGLRRLHTDERGNYIAEAVIILAVSIVGAYGLLYGIRWFIERFAERAKALEEAAG